MSTHTGQTMSVDGKKKNPKFLMVGPYCSHQDTPRLVLGRHTGNEYVYTCTQAYMHV